MLVVAGSTFATERAEVTIFVAASAGPAIEEIVRAWRVQGNQTVVSCIAGASSLLATQIIAGASADIFISADHRWMDELEKKKQIDPASRVDLLANSLVIISPKGQPITLTVEKGEPFAAMFSGRLAIGDPAHVPAGTYAQEALVALGWWESVRERLAPAPDVRAALRLVELGETSAGIVYLTDAIGSTKCEVVAKIPEQLHTPIRYPLALTNSARLAAKAFVRHLQGVEARAVFTKHGFSEPPKTVEAEKVPPAPKR